MKRLINFGSIKQFRNVIRDVKHATDFQGFDESGEPIFKKDSVYPTIKVIGSEKIHGTNASVCYSHPDGLWVQSKNNIITLENDNAGCAFWVEQTREAWMEIIIDFAEKHKLDYNKEIITIYFEWSGGSIQKNSACSNMDKRAIIFQHFKVSPIDVNETKVSGEELHSYWLETISDTGKWRDSVENNIFNIMNYKTWNININFNSPFLSQNEMIRIVNEEIEPNSPYAQAMKVDGNIGEGMVVTFMYKNQLYKFKVKGEKHSNSKVKTLKLVNEEKENNKIEFANYACSSSRLEQAWQTVFGIDNREQEPNIKFTGDFIRAVIKDVMKEELDILADKGLEPKEVNSSISKIAKIWFMEELDKYMMSN